MYDRLTATVNADAAVAATGHCRVACGRTTGWRPRSQLEPLLRSQPVWMARRAGEDAAWRSEWFGASSRGVTVDGLSSAMVQSGPAASTTGSRQRYPAAWSSARGTVVSCGSRVRTAGFRTSAPTATILDARRVSGPADF